MKKLTYSLFFTLLFSLMATADTVSSDPISSETFESYTVGQKFTSASLWSFTAPNLSFITNSSFISSNSLITTPPTTLGEKALALDTDARISRAVSESVENMEGGFYFDAIVQMTPSTFAPTPQDGDKIIVWLYACESDDSLFGAKTNLVATAASVSEADEVTITNYLLTTTAITPDEWCRLTIKATTNLATRAISNARIPGFEVWVNGVQQSTAENQKTFASIVRSTDTRAKTLTAVDFEGTGALDIITFTRENPFASSQTSFTFDLVMGEGIEIYAQDFKYKIGDDSAELDLTGPFVVPQGTTSLQITANALQDVTLHAEGMELSKSESAQQSENPDDDATYYKWTISTNFVGVASGDIVSVTLTATAPNFAIQNADGEMVEVPSEIMNNVNSTTGIPIADAGDMSLEDCISEGEEGGKLIRLGSRAGAPELSVPSFYDVGVTPNGFELTLNESAITIGDSEDGEIPAFEKTQDAEGAPIFRINLTTTSPKLWYSIAFTDSIDSAWEQTPWVRGTGSQMQIEAPQGETSSRFYRLLVTDEPK